MNDRLIAYWSHVRMLAHRGLPVEAESYSNKQSSLIVVTEKTASTITISLRDQRDYRASTSIQELSTIIAEYRKKLSLAKIQAIDFDAYIAYKLFAIHNNETGNIANSNVNSNSLADMVKLATSLSHGQRALNNRLNVTTRRPLRILVASMRSYPFGGGEAWISESSLWLQNQGHEVIIINFKESDWSLIPYNICELVNRVPRIGVELVDTDEKAISIFREIVSLFVPDVIHCQGELNSLLNHYYDPAWPPLICGYHFWNGIVRLGEQNNKNILSNIRQVSIDHNFAKNTKFSRYHPYIVSVFMRDVVKQAGFFGDIEEIPPAEKRLKPIESLACIKACSYDFVQLNCSLLKGGLSFIKLANILDGFTFFGLCPLWEELVELKEAAQKEGLQVDLDQNQLVINKNSSIKWQWIEDVGTVISETKVLLSLSLVDETYGRVIPESIELQRPVIASAKGNHRYLLPSKYLVDPEHIDDVAFKLRNLVSQPEAWQSAITEQTQFLDINTACGKQKFLDYIDKISKTCFLNHIAILAPWSEQGLGYHAKTYADSLRLAGITPHIYSFQSYAAENIGLAIQSRPEEWEGYDVHFSYNHRESLTAREIHQFCMHKNCKVLLALEVCWEVNWMRLKELAKLGIDVIPIPNSETIRKSEIIEHTHFPRVLCSTRLVETILIDNKISNIHWIGHGFGSQLSNLEISARLNTLSRYDKEGIVQLVHIAGYNHKRKMTRELLYVLGPLLKHHPNIRLRVLSQVPFDSECYEYSSQCNNIEMIQGALSHADIMAEYRQASFSLQLSTHEGLGLGFYESISCGTPVITINRSPHNEPIINNVTGLLVDATDIDLYDNDEALIKGGIFSQDDLEKVVKSLDSSLAIQLSRSCIIKHSTDYSLEALSNRLVDALGGLL